MLHADFSSNIAFVKVTTHQGLPAAKFGKLQSVLNGESVVAPGCEPLYSGWKNAESVYDLGRLRYWKCISSTWDLLLFVGNKF